MRGLSSLLSSLLSSTLVVVVAVLLFAERTLACAVCGSAKAVNDWAFGVSTLVLMFLPPILFGVVLFFVFRAHKKRQAEDVLARFTTPAE